MSSSSAPLYTRAKVVMYPWGDGRRLHTGFYMNPALRSIHDNAAAMGYFTESPVDCPNSADPEDLDYKLYPNKAVTAILPEQHRLCAPLGNVVVFKHPLTDLPSATNRTLPIIDILPADIPFVDELVRHWSYRLSTVAQQTGSLPSSSDPLPALPK
ncbi:hypothetical protein B0H13DRAFT_2355298 [Mycena leptocephala]|nr:hypothetical protein B0H13DRAFT_2355298 [Mycena leptocephala]